MIASVSPASFPSFVDLLRYLRKRAELSQRVADRSRDLPIPDELPSKEPDELRLRDADRSGGVPAVERYSGTHALGLCGFRCRRR